jgi:ubiquinone/menaquinone biosynthesis C-methylase UbiE
MRRKLYEIYWKIRSVITPTLRHSQSIYEDVLSSHVKPDMKWLDLGCGHQVLPLWREEEEQRLVASCGTIVGIDYDLPSLRKHRSVSLRVRGDINTLPFKDSYLDLVTANMVVEHLAEPAIQFREINRILKPGGIFLFHTPNAIGYPSILAKLTPENLKHKLIHLLDGRKEEDVFETHYKANTRNQIVSLAEMVGVEARKIRMTVSDAIFALVPPVAIPELAYIKMLMMPRFERLRPDIIAILRKNRTASAS